ncbi:hypothetical protein B0H63DRAFT_464749 [Podospora didyma]|uniref:Uncharacterized protein n=1 Tax=Podospora didyma TaxID=330526 RepID=A0AAE0U4A6_9PEZI|nr:hypothetical protein B0H63DRAFT_464749 [Podospora didyma]
MKLHSSTLALVFAMLSSGTLATVTIVESENGGFSAISIPDAAPQALHNRRELMGRTNGGCAHDNCLRALLGRPSVASSFCQTFTTQPPYTATTSLGPFQTFCAANPSRISSACKCAVTPTPTSTTSTSSSTTSSSTSSSTSAAPTCGPPGAPCTINDFIQACCHASDGSVGCYFPTGDPFNGICFV